MPASDWNPPGIHGGYPVSGRSEGREGVMQCVRPQLKVRCPAVLTIPALACCVGRSPATPIPQAEQRPQATGGTFAAGAVSDTARSNSNPDRTALTRRVFGRYSADDPGTLAAVLARDLPKIFTWQNVWRIADRTGASASGESPLQLDVRVLDENSNEPIPAQLTVGERIEVRVKNAGPDALHVTLLFLDGNFGITLMHSGGVEGGAEFRTAGAVTGDSIGAEGFVALAVPLKQQETPTDYAFLEQTPLGSLQKAQRTRGTRPQSPFGRLMHAATFGTGLRGFAPESSDTPHVISRSWITVPGGEDGPER